MRSARGAVLAMVIMTAFVCSIAAYTVLIMASSGSRQGTFTRDRARSRYAAEAGIVWAMQRLYRDPTFSSGTGTDFSVAVGTQTVNVDVIIPSCKRTPCETRELTSTVSF